MTTASRGIVYFVLSQLCLVADATAIHHLGMGGLGVGQIILVRSVGTLALLVFLARDAGFAILRTTQPGAQILRGVLTLVSMWLIFYSLSHMLLADATAISYTRPIWITLLGLLILREVVSPERWAATGVGLLGALVIIGPVFSDWNVVYFVALLGAALNGAAVVASRHLNRLDPPITIMAYVTLVGLVGGAPFAFEPLPWDQWPALLLIAAAGGASMWFGLLAIRDADVSLLAPYDYVRLPILMVLGLVLFAEFPPWTTLLGSALIILAGGALFVRELRGRTQASATKHP
jgi:drug/metabolite transporter (DMT)-like permease